MQRQPRPNGEDKATVELRVPKLADSPFDAYFRTLITETLLRSAEAEYDYHRNAGHILRARRAARIIARVETLQRASAGGTAARFGAGALLVTKIAWIACLAALAWITLSYGVQSWATGVADIAVIVLTFAWFAVSWGSDPGR